MAFSCLADFDRNTNIWGDEYPQRFDFFMAVFVIALVIVLFVFFVFLLNLEGNITTERNWNILVSILMTLVLIVNNRGGEGGCYQRKVFVSTARAHVETGQNSLIIITVNFLLMDTLYDGHLPKTPKKET